MSEQKRLSDKEVDESAIQILETFIAAITSAVKERGLEGDEPVLLNVLHNGLFGVLMQTRLFYPKEK